MRLAYLGHCILKLTKNGTDVHEKGQPLQQTVTVPWGQRRTQSLESWRIRITDAAVGQRGYYRTTMTTGLSTGTLHLPLLVLHHIFSKQFIAHEPKIFRISHNSSDSSILLDSWVTSTPCQNAGPIEKNACPNIFVKKHNMFKSWSIKDLENIFCLLWNWIPEGYDELLFHGWYKIWNQLQVTHRSRTYALK